VEWPHHLRVYKSVANVSPITRYMHILDGQEESSKHEHLKFINLI
jgi:hypothetical protein